jgi:integrase
LNIWAGDPSYETITSGVEAGWTGPGRVRRQVDRGGLLRGFNQRAEAAKVRPIGPHQIRHLVASTLLDAGYGVHEVAERLGHDQSILMLY